jgi:hypothetical protein
MTGTDYVPLTPETAAGPIQIGPGTFYDKRRRCHTFVFKSGSTIVYPRANTADKAMQLRADWISRCQEFDKPWTEIGQ